MAVKLGRVNVDAMLRSITARQFMEWMAYARLEPFDEVRADYRAASICALLANINRGAKQKAYTIEDFLLKFDRTKTRRQTAQEQEQIARAIVLAFNSGAREL